jgi:hypothetical protein
MNEKVINKLMNAIKDKLNDVITNDIEKLLDNVNCPKMEEDIQKNITDCINVAIEQCDIVLENYYDGEYDGDSDEEESLFDE